MTSFPSRSVGFSAVLVVLMGLPTPGKAQVVQVIAATQSSDPSVGFSALASLGASAGVPLVNRSGRVAFSGTKGSADPELIWVFDGVNYTSRGVAGPGNLFNLCPSSENPANFPARFSLLSFGDLGQVHFDSSIGLVDFPGMTSSEFVGIGANGAPSVQVQRTSSGSDGNGIYGLSNSGWLYANSLAGRSSTLSFNGTNCPSGASCPDVTNVELNGFDICGDPVVQTFDDGTRRVVDTASSATITSNGTVAFVAGVSVTDPPGPTNGALVYRSPAGTYRLFGLQGSAAQGWPSGYTFNNPPTTHVASDTSLAFISDVAVGNTFQAGTGLWVVPDPESGPNSPAGVPVLLAAISYVDSASNSTLPLTNAPGGPVARVGGIYPSIQINNRGEVAFQADFAETAQGFERYVGGFYVYTPNGIRLVTLLVGQNDPGPGFSGVGAQGPLFLNDAGLLAFVALRLDPGRSQYGFAIEEAPGLVSTSLIVGDTGDRIAIPLQGGLFDVRRVMDFSRPSFGNISANSGRRFFTDDGRLIARVQLRDAANRQSEAIVLISADPCRGSRAEERNVRCIGDYDLSGNLDQDDILYLLNAVTGGADAGCRDLDFNQDGNVGQDDIDALIDFVAGGTPPPGCQ